MLKWVRIAPGAAPVTPLFNVFIDDLPRTLGTRKKEVSIGDAKINL